MWAFHQGAQRHSLELPDHALYLMPVHSSSLSCHELHLPAQNEQNPDFSIYQQQPNHAPSLCFHDGPLQARRTMLKLPAAWLVQTLSLIHI